MKKKYIGLLFSFISASLLANDIHHVDVYGIRLNMDKSQVVTELKKVCAPKPTIDGDKKGEKLLFAEKTENYPSLTINTLSCYLRDDTRLNVFLFNNSVLRVTAGQHIRLPQGNSDDEILKAVAAYYRPLMAAYGNTDLESGGAFLFEESRDEKERKPWFDFNRCWGSCVEYKNTFRITGVAHYASVFIRRTEPKMDTVRVLVDTNALKSLENHFSD
ncbi:hypothetical protein [Glaesserella sp.]|uniref:hypothetical protein n=1 Tax=Glaesserella sp. TaxID=2094731 RepID=UPI00359F2FCF